MRFQMIDGKIYRAVNLALQPNGDILITARLEESIPVAVEAAGSTGFCAPTVNHADGRTEGACQL